MEIEEEKIYHERNQRNKTKGLSSFAGKRRVRNASNYLRLYIRSSNVEEIEIGNHRR